VLLPCPILPHAAEAHAIHKSLPTIGNNLPHLFRKAVHGTQHIFHAAATHAESLVSGACHPFPGALAIATLGVLASSPMARSPQTAIAPLGIAAQPPIQQNPAGKSPGLDEPAVPDFGLGQGAPTAPRSADPGSALITLTPSEIAPPPSASEILAPYMAASPSGATMANARSLATASNSGTAPPASASDAQPVPEPPSLIVLTLAVYGLTLVRYGLFAQDERVFPS
jgi:hypothetical protein